ncbi:hypothetical protein L211DRAFT_260280 [Terfezia boudieri ATCC MYA-4762]|uniref:Anaphase-promoting complex subunit 2 n=1 Tax=Terfezia boudieri ATCC MYA-4762 TaxID=1051890 RepID=A0A3N4M282_9PEZI|nr:hypothetical protein L211DRAFT_260280 [Terfezia boudieri ATCC MYA-4762]
METTFSTPPRPYQHTTTPLAPMGPPPPPPSHASPCRDYTPYLTTGNSVLSRRRKRVFESVFPPSDAIAAGVPTPVASFIGSTQSQSSQSQSQSQGQSQGQNQDIQSQGSGGVSSQGVRDWDRAWHAATTVLRFEDGGFEGALVRDETPWVTLKNKYISQKEVAMSKYPGVESGIRALLTKVAEEDAEQASLGCGCGEARTVPSLVEWYSWEVKRHYLAWIKPKIVDELLHVDERKGVAPSEWRLRSILERLRGAWEVYVGVGRRWVFKKVRVGSARSGQGGSRVGEALFGSGRKDEANSGSLQVDDEEDTEDDEEFVVGYVDEEMDGDVDEFALGRFVSSLNSVLSFSLRDPEWSRLVYEVFIEWCGCILNSPPGMAGDEEDDEGQEEQQGEEQPSDGDISSLDTPSIIIDDSIIADPEELTQIDDDMLLNTPTSTASHSRSRNQSRFPLGDLYSKTAAPIKRTKKQIAAQASLLTAWSHLQTLNLGGSGRRGERVFAEVISVLVTKYIEGMYANHWANEDEEGNAKDVTVDIGLWIEREVGGLVRLVLIGDGKGKGKKEGGGRNGRRNGGVDREARDRVLSPRASFRASELGIGGASVRRRGASRLSIDGVMLGATPTGGTRRGGGLAALAALAGVDVGRLLIRNMKKGDADRKGEEDVSVVVLRKEDIEGWKKMALGRLGRLRVRELFEIVVDWPDSLGGVMDLRAYITTPQTRMHLTTSFTTAINNRILHPAASTTDILRVYISLIRAFSVLDPRGVLLDRVTRGIRRYLREREDTVRVIVKGLMGGDWSAVKREDDDHAHSSGNNTRGFEEDDLADLAEDLFRGSTTPASQSATLGDELDFDDMTWVPDPIDAGPEYRRIKGTDVVGSLISLYESKEVFVKEFQAVLAERLLECRDYEGVSEEVKSYEPEIQTLELLRGRFGEGSVQGCDVMLRDIQVGARTDANVRNEEKLLSAKDGGVEFHAKILSHLFWPTEMKDEAAVSGATGGAGGVAWGGMGGAWVAGQGEKKQLYKLPKEIEDLQKRYEHGFEKLNGKRKLEWRDALGYVRVELELEDRIVEVRDAKPWCVAVINAFGDNESGGGSAEDGERWKRVRKTVKELRRELEMSEGLVRRGLQYWVAKGVLREVKPSPSSSTAATAGNETYIVMERIDDISDDSPSTTTKESTSTAGQEEEVEVEVEMDTTPDAGDRYAEQPLSAEKQVYAQFIVGMLTNAAGPMGLDRIMMMLGMLVPGGVRCGREEMGELVERTVVFIFIFIFNFWHGLRSVVGGALIVLLLHWVAFTMACVY